MKHALFLLPIRQLIDTQPSAGLLLLTSTVEELGQFNEDCPMKRCHQLKAALHQHVAHVVTLLHLLLKRENRELQGNIADDLIVV